MKKVLAVAVILLSSVGHSHAEVVASIDATASIDGMKPASKIYLTDTATKSYDKLEAMFKAAGFQVVERRDDADYYVSISKLQMLVEKDGKKIYIDHYNLDEFKSYSVAPAIDASDLRVDGGEAKAGKVRGALDMDGGVVAQGSRLAGSGAGGMAIGMLGGLLGGLLDRAASKSDDPPKDLVFVRGAIQDKNAAKGAKFLIGVGTTAPVSPTVLFDAAIQQYVRTLIDGYAKSERPG
jgi:hypothetical protein